MNGTLLGILTAIAVVLVSVFVLVFPVKLAARAMGAKRSGAGWCLLALVGASLMQVLGLAVPVYGTIVAFLLSCAAFAAILGTSFLRGIGIAILHMIFTVLLLLVAALIMGGAGAVTFL